MESTFLTALLTPDLPDIAPIFTPTALLVTSAMVGCIGAVVLLLSRQQEQPELGVAEDTAQVPVAASPAPQNEAPDRPEMPGPSPEHHPAGAHPTQEARPLAAVAPACACTAVAESPADEIVELSAVAVAPAGATVAEESAPGERLGNARATQSQPKTLGPSALLAQAQRLVPAAAVQHAADNPSDRSRNAVGFQPAARFSRSQQAFLRIPVVISGTNEAGAAFREETTTVILLPQGAVIHMTQPLAAGDTVKVFSEPRQQEIACTVYGVLRGTDGKALVEIEFEQFQHKSFWPVSFPAWAGKATANPPANQASRAVSPARTPVMSNSGS